MPFRALVLQGTSCTTIASRARLVPLGVNVSIVLWSVCHTVPALVLLPIWGNVLSFAGA